MLKWDKYKLMTPADKEEWNYRFKDHIEYSGAPSPILSILIIWLVFQTTLMVYFLMMKEYLDVALSFTDAFVYVCSIALVMLLAWIISLLVGVIILVYWNIQANKWLKSRGYK